MAIPPAPNRCTASAAKAAAYTYVGRLATGTSRGTSKRRTATPQEAGSGFSHTPGTSTARCPTSPPARIPSRHDGSRSSSAGTVCDPLETIATRNARFPSAPDQRQEPPVGPDVEQHVVRVGDLFARLGEFEGQIILAEVSRTDAEQPVPRVVASIRAGRLPVFEAIPQRFGRFGNDESIEPSGRRGDGDQADAAAAIRGQPPSQPRRPAERQQPAPMPRRPARQQARRTPSGFSSATDSTAAAAVQNSADCRLPARPRATGIRRAPQPDDGRARQHPRQRVGQREHADRLARLQALFPQHPGRIVAGNAHANEFGTQLAASARSHSSAARGSAGRPVRSSDCISDFIFAYSRRDSAKPP